MEPEPALLPIRPLPWAKPDAVTNCLTVEAVGGPLQLNYRSDGHMMMKGPAVTVYEGEMEIPDNILK